MKLLTIKEVQEILGGRSRSSIYRDIELNRIPLPYKYGSRTLRRDDDIDQMLNSLSKLVRHKGGERDAQS